MTRAHANVSPRHRPMTAGSDNGASPRPDAATATEAFPSMERNPFQLRADPDAQATVTDFLDFTEYLPSDMARSLTLIGSLDQSYIDASTKVHELTDLWAKLPSVPATSRPAPVDLRADISARLNQGMSARLYAHAEALRMAENVNRHYFRAKTILSKLQTMLENYPEAEQQQQEQQHQKQQREKEQQQQQQQTSRGAGKKPKKASQPRVHRQPVPRICVPGEVLSPYDLDYESYSGDSDISSPTSDDGSPPPMRRAGAASASAAQSRIKGAAGAAGTGFTSASMKAARAAAAAAASLGTAPGAGPALGTPASAAAAAAAAAGLLGSTPKAAKTPKTPKARVPKPPRLPGETPHISTSSALAKLKPPPENAVIGGPDAPWLQLTPYELAKLRKRMKKNASWTPSETMIARELKLLGRNLDAFNMARKAAEVEGKAFEGSLPEPTIESDGIARVSMGALTVDAAMAAEDNHLTNRGIKLNEAKKLKNRWAQLAAQEAEESTRKMMEAARAMMSYPGGSSAGAEGSKPATPAAAATRKRKREGGPSSDLADTVESGDGSSQAEGQAAQKRFKTETPVPIPQPAKSGNSVPPSDGPAHGPAAAHTHAHHVRHSTTPVPAPVVGGPGSQPDANSSQAPQPTLSGQSTSLSSPLSTAGQSTMSAGVAATTAATAATATTATTTTTVPLKPPAETPIHPPMHKSTTPIHPPVRELRNRDAARKDQRQQQQHLQPPGADAGEAEAEPQPGAGRTSRASSRALTPGASSLLPSTEAGAGAGAGASAAVSSAASASAAIAERPRRASTVRNTPGPEAAGAGAGAGAAGAAGKRIKRPAPGVVSRTSSGGSAAVGQRTAATRKKRGSNAAQQRRSLTADGEVPGSSTTTSTGGEIEVDDDGNVIDPNEPRYCLCNRVSFGTMIQCDNVDNCKQEWFHLECVDLPAVPARTTKWFCPECRVLLHLGEKGEVSARGVKM